MRFVVVIFGSKFGLFAEKGFAILARNLIIVGMDFGESEKAVAVAAVIDEGRLEGRFDARDLGEIDVALELPALGGLEIKFLDAGSVDDGDAGLLRVAGVDQHTLGHSDTPWRAPGRRRRRRGRCAKK